MLTHERNMAISGACDDPLLTSLSSGAILE